MTALSALEDPLDEQSKRVLEWVKEALELRFGVADDPDGVLQGAPQDTIQEVMHLLRRVRARADRVDELQAKALLAKGRAKRVQENAAFLADQKLSEAAKDHASKRADFSTGFERQSEAKLDAFEERRTAYQAGKLVSVTDDAFRVINGCHYQLKTMRDDLRAFLHALQFESSLER